MLLLQWRQVDFAAGEVRIDDPRSTKNEQARVFPLYKGTSTDSRKLRAGDPRLTAEEKGALSYFIGFQKFRTTWYRATVNAGGVDEFRHTCQRILDGGRVHEYVDRSDVRMFTDDLLKIAHRQVYASVFSKELQARVNRVFKERGALIVPMPANYGRS